MNKLPSEYKDIISMKVLLPIIIGIGVFLFWFIGYPQVLSYDEQYQLFLWTSDYFIQNASVPGGVACYVGEFLTQFYYVGWAGALILAVLFASIQVLFFLYNAEKSKTAALIYSVVPVLLLLCLMGDESVLLSYVVAMSFALLIAVIFRKTSIYWDILIIPCLYWLIGPMAWLYILLRSVTARKPIYMISAIYMIALQLLAYNTILCQWPLDVVLLYMGYYRQYMGFPYMIFEVPVLMSLLTLSLYIHLIKNIKVNVTIWSILVLAFTAFNWDYDKDKYELINQDYLIRNERWNEVIANADKYTVQTSFWSNSVDLSLAMTGQLSNRQFSFFQSGVDALLMPMHRDLTSNLPTMEAFYRLGLINESMRYAFDIQESIPYGKKSGRLCKRIAECCIINGKYAIARKYIDLLKKSLFYKDWAENAEKCLANESWINSSPEWGRLRELRFKEDFLFSYDEKDKVLGRLFVNNPKNKMALEYFLAELLLNGEVQQFMQYLSWAQQYGGYSSMPYTYQDAAKCIQSQGQAPGSQYGKYAAQMKAMLSQRDEMLNQESAH